METYTFIFILIALFSILFEYSSCRDLQYDLLNGYVIFCHCYSV